MGVGGDEENFLDCAGAGVLAFQACIGGVLDFETGRGVTAARFYSAWDDAADVGAVSDDHVEEIIEARDAAMLAFDAAEFHGWGIIGERWTGGG